MFNPEDFQLTNIFTSKKAFEWLGLNIYCHSDFDSKIWSFEISGINLFAEESLRLDGQIGDSCTPETLSVAVKEMFNNPYKNAHHKIIKGALCGEIINDILFLGKI